jgi:biopolymer transport protein ExbB
MISIGAAVPEATAREDGERVALEFLWQLRSHLRVLEATSQLAPLLGLFGTVAGMMSAFQALQSTGSDADPAALAGGIWVALITTAVGLAVAIPASFLLYWFEGRIERERSLIESSLTLVFTSLQAASRAPGGLPPVALGALDGSHAAE